ERRPSAFVSRPHRPTHSRSHPVPRSDRPDDTGGLPMNLIELDRALKKLRLGGIAAILETRLQQAPSERMAPIDLIATLVQDELTKRADRLLERRRKQAAFRDPGTCQ